MPIKKKKKVAKKRTGGLAAYQRKIKSAPGVKSATRMITTLEVKLRAAKKKKAAAVKVAQKKFKKK
jgi:hypothetical protein